MTQSIFLTVKKMLGVAEEYHAFDLDITIHINSVFLTLNQLGIGPKTPFQITGEEEIWDDFADPTEVPGIQTYVYLKTRLLFDPPTNSFLVDAIQKQIAELEWRMNVQIDPKLINEEEPIEPEEPKEVLVELTAEQVEAIYRMLVSTDPSKPGDINQEILTEMTVEQVEAIYSIFGDTPITTMSLRTPVKAKATKRTERAIDKLLKQRRAEQ